MDFLLKNFFSRVFIQAFFDLNLALFGVQKSGHTVVAHLYSELGPGTGRNIAVLAGPGRAFLEMDRAGRAGLDPGPRATAGRAVIVNFSKKNRTKTISD